MGRELIISLMVAGVAAQAGQKTPKPDMQRVVACMEKDANSAVVTRAQGVAVKIFAGVGVKLEWHGYHACPAGQERTIKISLVQHTGQTLKPGALAYAEPFEGIHIRVFYDRVQSAVDSQTVPVLLAHVLVHEITHMLEGSDQHSDSGVMKRRWDRNDYLQMAQRTLTFTEEDVVLIHNGLAARAH